jgi:hypothetical protein
MNQMLEAIAVYGDRVKHLEELLVLYQAGELAPELLAGAIDRAIQSTEADRAIFDAIYAKMLGPFDLEKYAAYQEFIAERLGLVVKAKELYQEELITFEQWIAAYGIFEAWWKAGEGWRETLRKEIESDPEWIDQQRRQALRAKGLRVPTEKRAKRKQSEAEKFNRRLREMRRRQ